MTRPVLRVAPPPRPDCCDTGRPVGSCPLHDAWRRVQFIPTPRTPHDDDQEDDQWQ